MPEDTILKAYHRMIKNMENDVLDALQNALGINSGQSMAGKLYPYVGSGPKVWIMPDGTKTTTRPKDGQTCSNTDPSTGFDVEWMWDDLREQWFNVTSGPPTKNNTQTFHIKLPVEIEFLPFRLTIEAQKKCSCGSDSVNSPRHSDYCPKYNPEQ